MNVTCKNCGHLFKGKFCNNCGQSANTHRLNYASIWVDIRQGIFRFNDKFSFTTKQLFYRPGNAIRDYIDGKRLNYFQPISYLIIVGSIYVLLSHYFPIHIIADSSDTEYIFSGLNYTQMNEWTLSHYNHLMLLTVPLLAFSTFIVFKKQGYNFVEHFVIGSYTTAQRLLFLIITFPLQYLLDDTAYSQAYKWTSFIIGFLLAYWVHAQFFKGLSKLTTLKLLLISYVLFFVIVTVLVYLSLLFIHHFILKL